MKRLCWGVALCSVLSLGCYHVHVVSPRYSDKGPRSESHTVHAFFWGLLQPTDLTLDCVSDGVADIQYETNLGYSLLSVVTLGLWMPMEVQWTCLTDPQTQPHFP
jgi:hypothetical protein